MMAHQKQTGGEIKSDRELEFGGEMKSNQEIEFIEDYKNDKAVIMKQGFLTDLKQYIEDHIEIEPIMNAQSVVEESSKRAAQSDRIDRVYEKHDLMNKPQPSSKSSSEPSSKKIGDLETYLSIPIKEDTFSRKLLKWIDAKDFKDTEVYKTAGIDRRHFSKIRSNPDYKPSKSTAIALCLALKLNESELQELLKCAGYTLAKNNTFDLVIKFCLDRKIYNLIVVNTALNSVGLKGIGGLDEDSK